MNENSNSSELIYNLDKLHTTDLGRIRIKNNISLTDFQEPVLWCLNKIKSPDSIITRRGKNWYVSDDSCIITINTSSYTIITAHKK